MPGAFFGYGQARLCTTSPSRLNHTLPTSGTARFSSPLGVDDFVKKSSFIYYTREALEKAAPRIADFAEREGLHAHARSVTIRYE